MPSSDQPWPVEKIGRVARVVELVSVRLIESHAHALDIERFDPESYHTRFDAVAFTEKGQVDQKTPSSDLASGFEVVVFFDYHDTDEPEAGDEPGDELDANHLMAAFALEYRTQDEFKDSPALEEIDGDAVMAFSQFNAAFNAWPYWREYVQSMAARLGLPSVTVPILRVPNLPGR